MKTLKQIREASKVDIVPPTNTGSGEADDIKTPKMQGAKAFINKHVVQKTDYPVKQKSGSNDAIFNGTTTKKKRIADNDDQSAKAAYESAVNKKAEDIVKGMKKNKADFVKKYGKDAESVMYATANKMAKEESEELMDVDVFELLDGSEIELTREMMDKIDGVYEQLSDEQQDHFDNLFAQSRQTNTALLNWVRDL